jgi:hypothetical protein
MASLYVIHFNGAPNFDEAQTVVVDDEIAVQHVDGPLLPLRPGAARQHPKQLIEWPQSWPGMFAFQDGELLPESEVF